MIRIIVKDQPRPGGSKKAFSHGGKAWVVDANKHTKTWREAVRVAAHSQYSGEPSDEPLKANYIFYFNRPKSHYRAGKNSHLLKENAPKYHTKKPDLTKLIRSTEDALTGIIWVDDAQVYKRSDEKKYCEDLDTEGVMVEIKGVDK